MGNVNSLDDAELEEIRRTTKFTSEEIREMHEKFQRDFPEGVIRRHRFIDMYRVLFPGGDASRFAAHVFRAYDADGNGEIDFREFMTTLSVAAKGSVEDKLRWAFHLYDLDGNGTVSRTEATEMIMSIYRMQGVPDAKEKADYAAVQLFVILDKNQDDSLSLNEFVDGVKTSSAIRGLLQAAM